MEQFKYLRMTLTNWNSIQEINSRLKSGKACYHSEQIILSYSLLPKNMNIDKIYRTLILPVVLYGCETWSLTLREERRLTVLENGLLMRIFGPNRDAVIEEWRRLHNNELYDDLYCSPNIIHVMESWRMRWAEQVACMRDKRGAYRVLVGYLREGDHLEGLGVDGRTILKWIFKMWDGKAWWIDLAHNRDRWWALVNAVMNLQVP